jgi:hypothetical protein
MKLDSNSGHHGKSEEFTGVPTLQTVDLMPLIGSIRPFNPAKPASVSGR